MGTLPDRSDSALYFCGPNANRYRFLNLKHKKAMGSGGIPKLYKKVEQREKWVEKLDAITFRDSFSDEEVMDVLRAISSSELPGLPAAAACHARE